MSVLGTFQIFKKMDQTENMCQERIEKRFQNPYHLVFFEKCKVRPGFSTQAGMGSPGLSML
jgi:hypothetical protein